MLDGWNQTTTPRRREMFVNYGTLTERDADVILPLQLDTWFFQEIPSLGKMSIGANELTAAGDVAGFLAERLGAFYNAMSPLARFCSKLTVWYKSSPPILRTFNMSLDANTPTDLEAQLHASLGERSAVVGISSEFDLMIAVRASDGQIRDHWLLHQGSIHLQAQLGRDIRLSSQGKVALPWQARLVTPVTSVFRSNNQLTLLHARALWRRLRQLDPTIDAFPPAIDEDLVVTLAEPPRNTPADNRALQTRNAPRLEAALKRWQEATGQQFVWDVPLSQV